MRYFKTNTDFLWFVWDGKTMFYSSSLAWPIEDWCNDDENLTPETINKGCDGEWLPDESLYAYETDSNWNRL